MAEVFFENCLKPYMYDTDARTLWLMDGDLCLEIDDPGFVTNIRANATAISREEAYLLAYREHSTCTCET